MPFKVKDKFKYIIEKCSREKSNKSKRPKDVDSKLQDELISDALIAAELEEAYKYLTEKQKTVIQLRYLRGLTREKIGELLGIKHQTVAGHEKAARQKLQKILERLSSRRYS